MSDHSPVPPGALPGGSPPADYPSGPPLAPPLSPVPPGSIRPGVPWPAPPPPSPPRRERRTWVVAVAVVAAVALLGASLLLLLDDDGSDDRAATGLDPVPPGPTQPAPSPDPVPPPPATTPPADFEAVVDEIESFVEQERGLPFIEDVVVELAGDEEFQTRLFEDFDEDVADIETTGRVLEAVGLVEPGTDLVEAVRTLLGAGVVGFYDPTTNELVVRGTSTSPYVRSVIAHELTHALDDQYFELDRPELDDAPDEQGFGFTALVEGDASRIEDAYRATLTPEEQSDAFAEELGIGAGIDIFVVPPILYESLSAPYLLGPPLVDAILDDGGQDGVDGAFDAPPTTSEHVLEPDDYLDGEGAATVSTPAADGESIDEGVLGALGLAQLLGVSPITGGLLDDDIDPVVAGWGGDRYVAWDDLDGSGTCVRVAMVGDGAEEHEAIVDAIVDWSDRADTSVTVVDGETLTFTSCS